MVAIIISIIALFSATVLAYPPGWSNDIRVSNTSGWFQVNPSIDVDTFGNVNIVWLKYTAQFNDEIYYKKLDSNGNTILSEMRISFANETSRYPIVLSDMNANAHILWEDWRISDHPGIYYSSILSNGTLLINGTRLTNITSASESPRAVIDNSSSINIVWAEGYPGIDKEIYFMRLNNTGQLITNVTKLTTSSYDTYRPSIAVDKNNTLHVVYERFSIVTINFQNFDYYYLGYIHLFPNGTSIKNITNMLPSQSVQNPFISIGNDNSLNIITSYVPGSTSNLPDWRVRFLKLHQNGTYIQNYTLLHHQLNESSSVDYPQLVFDTYNNSHVTNWEVGGTREYSYLMLNSNGINVTHPINLGDDASSFGSQYTSIHNNSVYISLAKNPSPALEDIYFKRSLVKNLTPVLLVHGIYSDDSIWNLTNQSLINAGYDVFTVGAMQDQPQNGIFPSNGLIENSALQLKDAIDNVKAATGATKVNVVAHSMGGLVTRWYIRSPSYSHDIDKLIMLGTPNKGSWVAANPSAYLLMAINLFAGTTSANDIGRYEMIPGSSLLQNLNKDFGTKGVTMSSVAGYLQSDMMFFYDIGGLFFGKNSDSVVEVSSAKAPYADCFVSYVAHNDRLAGQSVAHSTNNTYYRYPSTINGIVQMLNNQSVSLSSCPSSSGLLRSGALQDEDPSNENRLEKYVYNGIINQSQISTVVSVTNPGGAFVALLNWSNSVNALSLEITNPVSSVINATTYQNFQSSYTSGTFLNISYENFIVNVTLAGNWTFKVHGPSNANLSRYTLTLFLSRNYSLELGSNSESYSPSSPMYLTARLQHDANPVVNATVVASIKKPDNTSSLVVYYDDGLHNDSLNDDGIYGATFNLTSLPGFYSVHVNASIAGQFMIQGDYGAMVETFPDLYLNASSIKLVPGIFAYTNTSINVSATIKNIGSKNATNVSVLFFDGNPGEGANLFGAVSIPLMAINNTRNVSVLFQPQGQSDINIHIIISDLAPYLESDYENNNVTKLLLYSSTTVALAPIPSVAVNETSTVFIQLQGMSISNASITYGTNAGSVLWTFGPNTFNPQTGFFQWIPNTYAAGEHNIIFNVTDGINSDSKNVTIIVFDYLTCDSVISANFTLDHDIIGCGGTALAFGLNSNTYLDCQGHKITGDNSSLGGIGILVAITANNTIKNCYISGFDYGIYAFSFPFISGSSVFVNNNMITNNSIGVSIGTERSGVITNNTINSNGIGIQISANSNKSIMYSNNISNNVEAIHVEGREHKLDTNTISNSTLGILLLNSENVLVNHSLIYDNTVAIAGVNALTTRVAYNTIVSNGYGFQLNSSSNNSLFPNYIWVNGINAYEDNNSNGNYWNDSQDGNYWSDFVNNSGYPLTYIVPGPGNGVDYHPLSQTNLPPFLYEIGNRTIVEGQTLVIQLNATDPNIYDTLAYSTNASLVIPSVSSFNTSSGLFVWTPTFQDSGNYSVRFAVSDGYLNDSEAIQIRVLNMNSPPSFSAIGNRSINETQQLIVQLQANDPDNDTLTFGTNANQILPSPFRFNSTTGLFNWTPFSNNSGSYLVKFNVTDGFSVINQTVNITVQNYLWCGDTVNGSVILDHDIGVCPGDGIRINGHNITLDCDGHAIVSSYNGVYTNVTLSSSGVIAYLSDFAVIKNCLISNFSNSGIYLLVNQNSRIYNNLISNNNNGIYMYNNNNSLIFNNTINTTRNSYSGVTVVGTNNSVFNNPIYGFYFGLFLYNKNNIAFDNFIVSNYVGIDLVGEYHLLYNNDIYGSSDSGIRNDFRGGNHTVRNNHLSNNNYAINFQNTDRNFIYNNLIQNGSFGIRMMNGVKTELSYNNISGIINGIWLTNITNSSFFGNRLSNNINANEDALSLNNIWNKSSIGNSWSDFPSNPGYPNTYIISGPGNGVDYWPQWNNTPPVTFGLPDLNFSEDVGFINNTIYLPFFANDTQTLPQNLVYSITDQTNVSIINCIIDPTKYLDCTTQQNANGRSNITIRVSDGEFANNDTLSIFVSPVNDPPIMQNLSNRTVLENQTLIIDVNATDIDNDPLLYGTNAAGVLPSTFSFNTTSGLFQWAPSYNDSGNYSVVFNVSDGTASDQKIVTISVIDVILNNPPVLSPIGSRIINENQTLVIDLNATDPENTTLTFSSNAVIALPSPSTLNSSSGLFVWIPTFFNSGNYSLTFTVSDGNLTDSETINISVVNVNLAPVLSALGSQTLTENQTLVIDVNATDPDNQTLAYSTNAGIIIPSPFTFNATSGLFRWTPTLNDSGNYLVSFNVTDGQLSDSKTVNVTVLNLVVNGPPILTPIGNRFVNETQTLAIQLQATDPENNTLTFGTNAYNVLPSPFSFNNVTGLFNWTPLLNNSGSYLVNFSVRDSLNNIDWELINITVQNYLWCGDTINQSVILDHDIGICSGNGLVMWNTGITLDCNGHVIKGSVMGSTKGINVLGGNNTIKNCTVQKFGSGIFAISYTTIENNVISNTTRGIESGFIYFTTIRNNLIAYNNIGISQTLDSFSNVERNTFYKNNLGLQLTSVLFNSVFSNYFINNTNGGVTVQGFGGFALNSTNNTFFNNSFINSAVFESAGNNNNRWNLSILGNFWSDFPTNPGYPNTYIVPGPGNGVDYHPIYNNTPPVMGGIPDVNISEDSGLNQNLLYLPDYANDSQTNPMNLVYSVVMQTNASIATCQIDPLKYLDCTPQANASGKSNITVRVSDGEFAANDTLLITVLPVNDPPTLLPFVNLTVTENQTLTIQPAVIDPDNASLAYSILNTTMSGYVFNASNGRILWRPNFNQYGNYTLVMQVSDGQYTINRSGIVIVKDAALATITLVGTPHIGTTVQFNISDPAAPGDYYQFALSLNSTPGIPLGDGRQVNLTWDLLFDLSVFSSSLIGISNGNGFLSPSGNGITTWYIPYATTLVNRTIYASFVSVNGSYPFPQNIVSVATSIPITFLP